MQFTAAALGFLAILSLFGVLGPVFMNDERGIFFLVGGVTLFGIFAAFSALLFVTAGDSDFS